MYDLIHTFQLLEGGLDAMAANERLAAMEQERQKRKNRKSKMDVCKCVFVVCSFDCAFFKTHKKHKHKQKNTKNKTIESFNVSNRHKSFQRGNHQKI